MTTTTSNPNNDVEARPDGRASTGVRQISLRIVEKYGLVLALFVVLAGFSIAQPSTYFSVGNLKAMIEAQAVVLILAIALSVPLRCGDFDLSVAGVMSASAALIGGLTTHGTSLGIAIVAAFALGLLVGSINGFLVVKVGVDSFVATLASATVLTGLAYIFTSSTVIVTLPIPLLNIARYPILGFEMIVWVGWLLVLLAWYVYERTPLGRYLLFIGGSRDSSRLAGLPVSRVRIGAFVVCSLICVVAGVMYAGSVGEVDPSAGAQFQLPPFAGCLLGATTIAVGRVNALGTLVATYFLVAGITGLELISSQVWIGDVFNGAALLLAVTFARLAAKSARAGGGE